MPAIQQKSSVRSVLGQGEYRLVSAAISFEPIQIDM